MSRTLTLPFILALAPAAAGQIPAPWDRPPGYSTGFGPGLRYSTFDPGQRRVPGTFQPNPTPAYARPVRGFGFGTGFAPVGGFGPVAYPGWGGYYGDYYGGAMGPTVVVENYPPPVGVVPAPAPAPLDPAY